MTSPPPSLSPPPPLSPSPFTILLPKTFSLPPSPFLLLTVPFKDRLIHTHEYKAFQYCISTDSFEPKSLDIINIGPSFRSHYGSFSPNSLFPLMRCELRGANAMAEDDEIVTFGASKKELSDQKELNLCAEGFGIGRLGWLMGSDAVNYTAELEDCTIKCSPSFIVWLGQWRRALLRFFNSDVSQGAINPCRSFPIIFFKDLGWSLFYIGP